MRRQLTEALLYPRSLVMQLTEEANRPHESLYQATGERCKHCDNPEECNWNNCLQDFRHFEEKSIDVLSESLREGIRLVESLHNELRHDETTCTCETCSWIRSAEHLAEECQLHLPHVEPATYHNASEEQLAK